MEYARKKFPNGLPSLSEIKKLNEGKNVPPETAWIWGADDEVRSLFGPQKPPLGNTESSLTLIENSSDASIFSLPRL
jgi:hypothetical protein